MPSIKVTIKPTSGGDKFQAEIETSATVRELKEEVARKCDTSADQQRLIYKGQVLKDDRTVDSYGLQNEHVLHMVKAKPQGASASSGASTSSAAASSAPGTGAATSTTPGSGGDLGLGGLQGLGGMGMGNPEQMQQAMSQMMNNPMMQSVLNDPEMLRNMFSSNPAIQQLMDRNPEFAQVLNNPQQLQEAMQAATNPALMREQMRNQDRTMANIESHPEGFNALRRMYENFQEPLMNAATGQGNNQQDPLAALLGNAAGSANPPAGGAASTASNTDSAPAASGAPNTAPLPNPWAPGSAPGGNAQGGAPAGLGGLGGLADLGGMPGFPAGLQGLGGAEGGAPDMNSMMQMLQQPGVQQAMQSLMAQPQVIRTMMDSNPQMRSMMDQNPQVRELMNNPDAMRQMLSPENMQAMMQMQQAMQRLQGTGLIPPAAGNGSMAGMDMSSLAAMFGGGGGGGLGGGGLGGVAGGVPPVADPETAYASQLTQLQDMGFSDRAANIRALQAVSGNVNAAVERLLSGV